MISLRQATDSGHWPCAEASGKRWLLQGPQPGDSPEPVCQPLPPCLEASVGLLGRGQEGEGSYVYFPIPYSQVSLPWLTWVALEDTEP